MVRSGYKECPYCAEEIKEKAIKCRYCHSMLTNAPSPPTQISPSEPTIFDSLPKEGEPLNWKGLQKFLPPKVAESILKGSETVEEGERRKITVLFADLTGFTAFTEDKDPEEVKLLIDDCFQLMVDAILKYQGTVDKYMGDAVMALFGAPDAHEDDPERAIRAAAEMREAVHDMGLKRNLDLELSFGITTGDVIVGGLGNQKHLEYTAIGDSVNLAYRLESAADSGQILINETTFECVRDIFKCLPIGPIKVKGKKKPIVVYEVAEIGEKTFQDARLYRQSLTPLVGRDDDLSRINKWVKSSFSGKSQIIHLTGEAGVGKSRLLLETRSALDLEKNKNWLVARCISFGLNFPYHPIIYCLQNFCGIKPQDNPEGIWKKITKTVDEEFIDFRMKRDIFAHLFGMEVRAGSNLLEFPPKERRDIIFKNLTDIFQTMAEKKPLVLVFEDLHWSDKATLSFLDFCLPLLNKSPISVFLVYRPHLSHHWPEGLNYRYIDLAELSDEDSEILLNQILHIPDMDKETKKKILLKSEGNPFYVEEIVRVLIEYGILEKKDDQYILVGDMDKAPIPDTVQGVILARLDRLQVQVKRVLQCASVIGFQFRYSLLDYLTKVQKHLKGYLTQLAGMEIIYEMSALPELEYLFKHLLTQEVTYSTLLHRRKREYHGRVAMLMEEIYSDRLNEHIEHIAHHYIHSKFVDKALEYSWEAGEKSRKLFANEAAIEFYSHRLNLLPEQPETNEDIREIIKTLLSKGDVLQLVGRTEEADKDFSRALNLSDKINDSVLLSRSTLAKAELDRFQGNLDSALEKFLKAEKIFEKIGKDSGLRDAQRGIGVIHWNKGEYPEAKEYFNKILSGEKSSTKLWDQANNWNNLGLADWSLGLYQEAAKDFQKSLEWREELGDKNGSIAGLNNLGVVWEKLGDYSKARDCYLNAFELAEETGFLLGEVASRINLGQIYAYQGELSLAQEHNVRALKLAQSSKDSHSEAMVMGNIGQVWCWKLQFEEAENWLQLASEKSLSLGDHDSLMNAEKGLAELDLARGNPTSAKVRLEKLIQSGDKNSHQDSLVTFRRLLAKTLRQLGEIDLSQKEGEKALEAAKAISHKGEEMWVLYELAQLHQKDEIKSSKEYKKALKIAKQLGIKSLLKSN